MKRPFLNRFFSIIALIAITTSCSSDLDFNQKIGELSPYFEVKDIFIAEFFNNSTAQTLSGNPSNYPLPPQTIPFDINTKLTDKGIVSYLKKVVFHATFTNTTNTTFTIKVVIVSPNTTNQDIVFLESDIPNLKSVTNLQFTGFITLTGASLPLGKLSVISDATIYL
jgi:hypothetical protein